jgi:CubicO group peptidase (beta-lactamase class C family)
MSTGIPPIDRSKAIQQLEPSKMNEIESILTSHYSSIPYGIPAGCNLAILQIGKTPLEDPILLKAGNIERNGPQHWGSVSKQFAAASVLKLVSEGKFSLEDDIRDPKFGLHLPEFTFEGQVQKITVEDLLRMQSGLPEMTTLTALAGRNDISSTLEEKFTILRKYPFLDAKPGTIEQYCNTNYYLLTAIVTKMDPKHRLFPDYVREEVFQRCQMECRSCTDPSSPNSIQGYDPKFHPIPLQYKGWGASGIIGKPSDMAKWNASIDRKEHEDLLEPGRRLALPSNEVYSRGLYVGKQGEYTVVRHSGSINGFVTQFMRFEHPDPSKTFAFFLASNVDDIPTSEKVVPEIANALAGKDLHMKVLMPPEPPVSVRVEVELLKPYVGIYENKALGLQYQVSIHDDQLLLLSLLNVQGPTIPFVPTKSHKQKEGDKIVFCGPIGDVLELTKTGLILRGAKVAPFVLERRT